jgi:hypothetical protein
MSNEELFNKYYLDYYKTYSKDDLAFHCRIIMGFNKYLSMGYTTNSILTKEGNV